MKLSHFAALRPLCPLCLRLQRQAFLTLSTVEVGDDTAIEQGILRCENLTCSREYPIIDGIPMLVADLREHVQRSLFQLIQRQDLAPQLASLLGDCCGPDSAWEITAQHLSSYGFDHWGDGNHACNTVHVAGSASRALAAGLALHTRPTPPGPLLDLGCAAGRTTCDLADAHPGRLVLGVDLNHALLRLAQQALRHGHISYPLRDNGLVYHHQSFSVSLPNADRVDVWAADVTNLPFANATFAGASSLHLLDSVWSPYHHLKEIARMLIDDGVTTLASPFDWSTRATEAASWIGGHSQRSRLQGDPCATLKPLLAELGLSLIAEGETQWQVRIHARHSASYQSWLGALRRSTRAAQDSLSASLPLK